MLTRLIETYRSVAHESVDVSSKMFDQQSYREDFLADRFKSSEWSDVISEMKSKGIRRLIPATENGFRNIAVRSLAKQAHLVNLTFKGNEIELPREVYVNQVGPQADPIDYQVLVAESKHYRIRRASNRILKRTRVITPDDLESHTSLVAFDTVIWLWENGMYVCKEKPKCREEAMETIELLVSGQEFLVSTVANIQSLLQIDEMGHAATVLPVRLEIHDRFERAALRQICNNLYDEVILGRAGKWKLTPSGTVSLMHPALQNFVKIGVTGDLSSNVIPKEFSKFEVETSPTEVMGYRSARYKNIGDRAYKRFADGIVNTGGYKSMKDMTPDLRQQVGMVFSGYSDVGMLEAFKRYLSVVATHSQSPLMAFRRGKQLVSMLKSL